MLTRRSFLANSALCAAAVNHRILASPAMVPGGAAQLVLVGDCLFNRSVVRDDRAFGEILPILRNATVAIGNFEGALADPDNTATLINPGGSPICGGTNVRGDAAVPGDLAWMGMDMVGTANNHALDWGIDGLLATGRKLDAAGIAHSGSGRDLPSARAPSFHKGSMGRTALISCTSTYWPGALASRPNGDIRGRPGINPLRYLKSDSAGSSATWVQPDDLREIVESVRVARDRSDQVVVSCHTHEGEDDWPPDFLRETAYACIDAGALAFFSHGPHKLRGVEAYKGRPIFYSLGAFIYRVRDDRPIPSELFENCHIESRDPEAYFRRTAREWVNDLPFWQSAIARIEVAGDKVLAVDLIPVLIRHNDDKYWGMPFLAKGAEAQAVLSRLQRLSVPYDTNLTVVGDIGRWKF